MGRALLSAFLQDLKDNLELLTLSGAKRFIMKPPRYQRKLITILSNLDALVDDAEEKQFARKGKAQAAKDWLNSLQNTVYRLEELLGQRQLQTTTNTKLNKPNTKAFVSLNYFGVFLKNKKLKAQIHDIMDSLEDLLKLKDTFGLIERHTLKETALDSNVLDNYFYGNYPKDYFYGREEEEKFMLEILLSASEHIKVINIEGEAGAGKTAFADSIYLNLKVRESFEIKIWLTFPYILSVNFLAKKILEAVTHEFVPVYDLHELSKKLKESFEGKKFLMVLDDIRFEDALGLENWKMLVASIDAAAGGSAIIFTSDPHDDNDDLLVKPNHSLHVLRLQPKNSLPIFLAHAFRQMDHHLYPNLVAVGRDIVDRLGNLPLAAKMIGSLLQDTPDLSQWVKIRESKLLGDGDANLPIPAFLVLCYLDLPAQLKRCFAYLSLFPKGYEFKQKEVVFLWMAQGFLQKSNTKSNDKSMEDVGDEYFGYLIMRSFLQPFGSGVSFTMHNLVHDLASYVFGELYKHHLSYSRSTQDFPESFLDKHRKLLRTILPVYLSLERAPSYMQPSVLENIIWQLNPQFFRAFSLSHYDIRELPDSIGRLSHLCYLDLSHTALQTLPDSICDLLNLQTLLLTGCTYLTSFPPKMCNLINLRCLDVRDSGVQEMPLQMNKMISLRTLMDFIVSKKEPRLEDLAGLSNLKSLTISKLENVAYFMQASNVNLKEKSSLHDLMLQWGNNEASNGNEMDVLENLEPHKGLKRLTIEYYGGARFPNWLRDPSYWALQLVDIRHCKNCILLPALGQLPVLKDLFIEGFTEVRSIGHEFYGPMSTSHKPFQSLETLQFWDMLEWEEWNILEGIEFPYLIELYIMRCPKLVRNLPKHLPSLQKLEISGCHQLVAPLPKLSNTCEVLVHDSNEILMRNVVKTHSHASLRRHVVISEEVHEITPQSYSGFTSNKYTIGSSIGEIEEIGHEEKMETEFTRNKLPPNLASLDTKRPPKLQELSSRLASHQAEADIPSIKQQTDPQSSLASDILGTTTHVRVETSSTQDIDDERPSFEILKVTTVSQLKLLPPNLHSLKIEGCESLEVLPSDLLGGLPVRQELYLISCSSLNSFPYPASLATLYIRNCERLEFPPSLDSRENLACLQHLFIGSSCDPLTTLTINLFPELKILCIWNCPNLLSFNYTHDLALSLESLEIRDCPGLKCFPDEGLNTPNLESMFISNSKSLYKLPNSMNSLTSLKSLYLHSCPLIESFPPGGLPSSLTLLSITYCDKLTPQKDWLLENLESLTHLEVEGGCIGMESFPDEMLLPRNIISLRISTMKSLKKLDYKGFQHLSSLQTLEIKCCDMLKSLPEQGFPSSLDYLCVQECPVLTPRLKPKTGKDWHKVARIPHLQIERIK